MGCDRCDRCLQDACFPLCSLSLHASLCQLARSRSLSFPLITLLLSFFSGFFWISLSLSFLLSLTFTLLRSISPSVSLHLHVVPALMQLLITNPLIFEVWFSLIWRTARGWRNKERHEQPTRSGGERRRAKSFRAFKITRHLWHKAVSGLSSDWLKPHYPVIYSIHKRSNLLSLLSQSVPLLQCMCKNAKERMSELLSALTYSECGNTQSPTQRVSEVSKMPSDNGLLYLSYSVWLPTTKASSMLKASAWLYVLKRTQKNNLRLCFEFFLFLNCPIEMLFFF